jgi:hypothetical protein
MRAREIAALKGEVVEQQPQPQTDAAPTPVQGEPQASASGLPSRALAEQIQLTARSSPATR